MRENGNWGGARPGSGRPRGSMNDTGISPRDLRAAVIEAAKNCKYGLDPADPDQPGSLTRFFIGVANEHPVAFCNLFSKLIPRHVYTQTETTVDIQYRTVDEVKEAMADAGWTPQQIETIQSMLPNTDDIEIEADEGRIKKEEEADEK